MNASDETLNDNPQWTSDAFEEEISASLISLYESKLVGQKKIHPRQRIEDGVLAAARKFGLYVPNPDRIIPDGVFDIGYALPEKAALSVTAKKSDRHDAINGYRHNFFIHRVDKMPPNFVRTGGGVLYKLVSMAALDKGGVDGDVHYVSVDKLGNLHVADFRLGLDFMSASEPHILEEHKFNSLVTLNFEADKINCWTIKAQESNACCTVSVGKEQVKSLLYARNLPVTATGRKRPILHLVTAHRRRLKEGTDIDIETFLRGVKTVEMNGTLFTVKPPLTLFKE